MIDEKIKEDQEYLDIRNPEAEDALIQKLIY
jgi:hypothetical protein